MYCPYNNATYPTGYCKPGYFCEKGSDTDRPETNHTGIAGPCTPGNYCPENTTYPLPCPKGRYSNQTHLKEPTDCNLCNPGSYCETPGLEEPSGQCDAGFYCLYGSELKNPPTVTSSGGPCPVGHYCTNGTSYPLSCDPGTFNDRTGQSECDKCCEGFYCPKNTTTCVNECPVGHYCPKGTSEPYSYPCPVGTYSNKTRRTSESDCTPCDPGMYCPNTGRTEPYDQCDGGWYCRRGAWSNTPIEMGNFTDSCYCSNVSTGGQCQPGQYCPKGSNEPRPCSPGLFFLFFFCLLWFRFFDHMIRLPICMICYKHYYIFHPLFVIISYY